MTRLQFIFYSAILLSMALFSGAIELSIGQQTIICGIFIALLGIPHGAIDHVLFLRKEPVSKTKFYVSYLLLIGANLAVWVFFPRIGFMVFLAISAYHFGQAQFSDIGKFRGVGGLFLTWGVSILAGLMLYNQEVLTQLVTDHADVQSLSFVLNAPMLTGLAVFGSAVVAGILIWLAIGGVITWERVLLEVFIVAIIHFAFYVLPLLVGFTLYFVVLHSLKVMEEEYTFLQGNERNFNVGKFVLLLVPMTSLSLLGLALVVFFIENDVLNLSYPLLFLLGLSAITLPHSVVMEKFYESTD